MKILYSAIDQPVPGTRGGSIHVRAVAEGLAALGHDVTALTAGGTSEEALPEGRVRWIALPPPFGSTHLRLARALQIARMVKVLRPDVVMERYHNFGGEALVAARKAGAMAVLEVNAPVIDHQGSRKALLDRALIIQPMRRWREHLCDLADLIVSPSAEILPANTPRDRIVVLEWGADTDRFRPDTPGAAPYRRPAVDLLAVFAGAFRSWHGAVHLVRAVRELHRRGETRTGAVLIGDGPELSSVRTEAAGLDAVVFTGALPHAQMPAALAAADVGVAPFDPARHAALSLGFYWSPLKLFEYMAAGLPVVAPAIDRIPALAQHGVEGILYDPETPGSLADSLATLRDIDLRRRLGAAARARAVRDYSWLAHCRALEAAFRAARPIA
jgi:glycosyltransferase involved in cell wall biosynthesis